MVPKYDPTIALSLYPPVFKAYLVLARQAAGLEALERGPGRIRLEAFFARLATCT